MSVRLAAGAMLAAFLLLIAWLAITAPLSKSLQPIAPPQLTLLAADGTPIMLADSREAVVMNAHEQDLETVSLH